MAGMSSKTVLLALALLHVCNAQSDTLEPTAKFVGLSQNLSSGAVRILDDTIIIEDFHYTGFSPDAHFVVGAGSEPNGDGTQIPDEKGSMDILKGYHGENVTLQIPEVLKAEALIWLAVWCNLENEDIGHVILKRKVINVEDTNTTIEESKIGVSPNDSNVQDLNSAESKPDAIAADSIGRSIQTPALRSIGRFTTLAHGVSSGDILVIDNHTILITNFNYDGAGPDAYFWAGTGPGPSELGSIVPYGPPDERLGQFSSANITLHLPNGLSLNSIDWLSVWCVKYKHDFGHVIIRDIGDQKTGVRKTPIRVLPEFSRLAHGLRSGNISILDAKTILIQDLYYDGRGPDAHFWVGTGEGPDEDGMEVPYKEHDTTLPAFNGETVTLELPGDLTVNDIDYLGMWCIKFSQNFGSVALHPAFKPSYVELEPFKQLAHGLRSGPILIVDERTFFVTNLYYDGKGPDAYFWVGRSKTGPDGAGRRLKNELNSTEPLSMYEGDDVYISLPPDLTVYDITYFGMYCVKHEHNFGYTDIQADLLATSPMLPKALGLHEYNKDGMYIARVPKCCPIGKMKTPEGCVKSRKIATPLKMYEGNSTKLNDEELTNVVFEPYYYYPPCEHGMFSMDPLSEQFYLLTGGLLILGDGVIYTKDSFCTDTNHFEDDETETDLGWHNTAFICFVDSHPPEFLNIIIASCIYISAIFLIFTTVIFHCVREASFGRGYNVIGYSTTMALSFVFLASARIFHVMGTTCYVLGFFYQFFLISSFTWLCCLTYETFYRIRKFKSQYDQKRFYWYASVAMGLPLLGIILSFFIDKVLPMRGSQSSLGYEPCWFRSEKKVMFYFVPIGISIFFNIIYCIFIWVKIKRIDVGGDPLWKAGNQDKNLKNIFRSCYLLLMVMTLCWSAEVISYFFETRNGFWLAIDIIDSLQGLFVFLIFIMHNPVIGILKRNYYRICSREAGGEEEEFTALRTLDYSRRNRAPTLHKEALTKIHRCESNENIDED